MHLSLCLFENAVSSLQLLGYNFIFVYQSLVLFTILQFFFFFSFVWLLFFALFISKTVSDTFWLNKSTKRIVLSHLISAYISSICFALNTMKKRISERYKYKNRSLFKNVLIVHQARNITFFFY